jgi:hypothetical protein
MSKQPECPECEKLAKISEESNKIGSWEQLLAKYFEIDLDKAEKCSPRVWG